MKPHMHRGISFGTLFMLAVTLMVTVGSAVVLPRLMGRADIDFDAVRALSGLELGDALPALSLSDIPISDATAVPAATPVPAAEATAVPTATPAPTATPVPGGSVTLTIGGSVNIEDNIRKSAYYSDSGKYDFAEIMMLLREEMQSDLTLVTLENLTDSSESVSALNAPEAVMDMLAQTGVDMVALGFPKAADKGLDSLRATLDAARARGLTTLGAYADQADADTLRMFTIDNVNVAFLHYTSSVTSAGRKALNADGAAWAVPLTQTGNTPDRMLQEIRNARQSGADVVIVSLNWGALSAAKPTNAQQALAQQIADAGADVIVGAGSRVVQPVTWLTAKGEDGSIRHTLCAWSLGSLINDSRKDGNVCAMLLQLQIAFDGDSLSFEKVCYTPTYIWRYKQDGAYQYRIAVSDQTPPDGMSDEQAGYMDKALRNVRKYLDDSPVTLRER